MKTKNIGSFNELGWSVSNYLEKGLIPKWIIAEWVKAGHNDPCRYRRIENAVKGVFLICGFSLIRLLTYALKSAHITSLSLPIQMVIVIVSSIMTMLVLVIGGGWLFDRLRDWVCDKTGDFAPALSPILAHIIKYYIEHPDEITETVHTISDAEYKKFLKD